MIANMVYTKIIDINAKTHKINPAIDLPLELSFLIPSDPYMIAIIGKLIPTGGINSAIAHPQNNPRIPKINAIVPFLFDILNYSTFRLKDSALIIDSKI